MGTKIVNGPKRQADAKAQFMLNSEKGMTVEQACASVGRKYSTYRYWLRTDPAFAAKARSIYAAKRKSRHGNNEHMKNLNLFVEFRRKYFRMESYSHHQKMVEAIESAPDDSITLILGPPESGKTSLLEDWINYRLARDPNFRIAHISEGQDHARKVVGRVQLRMTDEEQFPDYISDYGPFKQEGRDSPRPWNRDYFTVMQSKNGERDYSLSARGITSKIYGSRYDLTILDDIQSQETLNTTDKLMTTIQGTLLSRGGRKGRIIVIGTRVGARDIYSRMIEQENFIDRLVMIPAFDDKGESYCPEMWPNEALARKRSKMSPDLWSMLYMQQPGDPQAQAFTLNLIEKSKDWHRGIGRGQMGDEVVCSVDPALDSGKCAFGSFALDAQKFNLLDCDVRTDMARNEDIFGVMVDYTRRYRPTTWIIETNNFQKGLAHDQRLQDIAARERFEIRDHKTGRNKLDPIVGVKSMAGSFVHDEISLPWAPDARAKVSELIAQLLNWKPGVAPKFLTQDLVMMMWFAWTYWQDQRQIYGQIPSPLWRPTWMRTA